MRQQIDENHLIEYWYPTIGFKRMLCNDNCFIETVVDYAEIEIIPTGIKKLEENLIRFGNQNNYTLDEWEELNNPDTDVYEHIIAYVHFNHNTNDFNQLFIEIIDGYDSISLDPDGLLTSIEQELIIKTALKSLQQGRDRNYSRYMTYKRKEIEIWDVGIKHVV